MDFGEAINLIKQKEKLRRSDWDREKYVRRFDPVDNDGMAKEGTQLVMNAGNDDWLLEPYNPTTRDMFADDWEVFK
ncbi:MW1434 family type I TA system toxin [Levilactobacillus brevis]|nr:MW1434 family type I TA system toxin [Levilactobacillus brevis]MBU5273755.1 DUF2829 domain-containing protein [Levilactobacillus brevis]MCT3598903.1 DUF2829 domain-containing protein [Levilactobacillus brevis]QOP52690.1 DUF2829 domain-containing protein [Levilactobacillus brevis]GEB75606.1 hypothetical protein LBR04_23450 [Levilactobacillus brevis]